MPQKTKISFAVLMFLVLTLASILIFPDHTNCRRSFQGEADLIIADLVNRLGGLPREELGTNERTVSNANVYSVDNWEIETVIVGNTTSLIKSITDDDPIYSYIIDFRAFYTDGSEQRLRWSSWRYGLVVCPVVFTLGDGPPGKLEMLD